MRVYNLCLSSCLYGHVNTVKVGRAVVLCVGSSPYLTSFDAVEQFWVWIPFQSHCTDYTLKDKNTILLN